MTRSYRAPPAPFAPHLGLSIGRESQPMKSSLLKKTDNASSIPRGIEPTAKRPYPAVGIPRQLLWVIPSRAVRYSAKTTLERSRDSAPAVFDMRLRRRAAGRKRCWSSLSRGPARSSWTCCPPLGFWGARGRGVGRQKGSWGKLAQICLARPPYVLALDTVVATDLPTWRRLAGMAGVAEVVDIVLRGFPAWEPRAARLYTERLLMASSSDFRAASPLRPLAGRPPASSAPNAAGTAPRPPGSSPIGPTELDLSLAIWSRRYSKARSVCLRANSRLGSSPAAGGGQPRGGRAGQICPGGRRP